jgi:hypothetical protein
MTNKYLRINLLTSDAKKLLVQASFEYRKAIIDNAYKAISSRYNEVNNISFSDILYSITNFENRIRNPKKKYYFRLFMIISVMGMFSALSGLSIFLLTAYKSNSLNELSLFSVITGLTISICGLLLYIVSDFRDNPKASFEQINLKKNKEISELDIIKKWQELESAIEHQINKTYKNKNRNIAPMQLIHSITNTNELNKRDKDEIYNILKVRNLIVHKNLNLSSNEIVKYLNRMDKIINKIKTI